MIGTMVQLKPKQAYGECLGVVTERLPRDHHPTHMYCVYVDGLGTVVRSERDLVPVTMEQIASGAIHIITPEMWMAQTEVIVCTSAMHAAMSQDDMSVAAQYADRIIVAQEKLHGQ